MLRITVLSENTAVRPGLDTEDGLSVFIETDRHKILMDAGWNDVFLNNAARLGAPVEEADAAVLSHDHYDHGQSFPLFFERMAGRKYLFYLSSDVLWPGYHRRPEGALTSTGCGLSDAELIRARVPHRYVEKSVFYPFADEPGVALLSRFEKRCDFEPMLDEFVKLRGGELVRDEFDHELAMALPVRDGLVLLTGCAHSGICNMILAAEERLGRPVVAVLGGTHLKASGPERALATIDFFNERPSLKTVAVCHCTGAPALQLFADHCRAYAPCGAGTVLDWQ